jgi:hypothetical protein
MYQSPPEFNVPQYIIPDPSVGPRKCAVKATGAAGRRTAAVDGGG